MFFKEENTDSFQEKNEYIYEYDYSEHERLMMSNIQSSNNEIINSGIKNIFRFDYLKINSENINDDNIYFIKDNNNKAEGNSLNNSTDKNNGTDLSSQKKVNYNNDKNCNCKKKNLPLGRKKKNSDEKGFHTKKFYDNIISKIKRVVLQVVRIFINKKIKEVYKSTKKLKDRELIKIKPEKFINTNIEFNRIFIHKSLEEIFSADTTIKNHCSSDHNKNLIKELLNSEKDIFEDIFKLKFLDILDYLVEKRPEIIQLKGLIFPEKLLETEDEDYTTSIRYIMENFEAILNGKIPRNKKRKRIKVI